MVKENPFEKLKYEIFYHIINSLIAGALVFAGSLADGEITLKGTIIALVVALTVGITKFRNYWQKKENSFTCKVINFI